MYLYVFYCMTNHCTYKRDVILIGLMKSIVVSMTLDCVSCFLASKTYEIHVNASITDKVIGGISFHVIGENLKHLKDTLEFTSFLEC